MGNPNATEEQIWNAIHTVSADEVIAHLEKGLDSDVGEGGDLLSTGEKQLISFARAILADPRILVLDEATSSVDTRTERHIEHGMDQARRRLAQHGIEISGDLYSIAIPGGTAKDQQIADHRVQASQIAQIVATITINDEFKLGEPKLRRIQEEVNALSARYAKEGEGFLLEEMQKIVKDLVK